MSEIEKLYENAGVKSEWRYTVHQFCHFYEADKEDILRNKYLFKASKTAKIKKAEKKYPPFTAEKQLELIKFLFNHNVYYDVDVKGNYWFHITDDCYTYYYNKFEIALANIINEMWQNLTEEEKEQIKEILI